MLVIRNMFPNLKSWNDTLISEPTETHLSDFLPPLFPTQGGVEKILSFRTLQYAPISSLQPIKQHLEPDIFHVKHVLKRECAPSCLLMFYQLWFKIRGYFFQDCEPLGGHSFFSTTSVSPKSGTFAPKIFWGRTHKTQSDWTNRLHCKKTQQVLDSRYSKKITCHTPRGASTPQ